MQRARAHAVGQRRSRVEGQQVEALRMEGKNTTRELHQQRVLNALHHRKEWVPSGS